MARKPKPRPLSYSRALIEREKLAVIQRTTHRIQQLNGGTPTDGPTTEPRGKWIKYTKVVAIGAISVALYTIMVRFLPCIVIAPVTCNCNCNV
jgi:hypothetical protein